MLTSSPFRCLLSLPTLSPPRPRRAEREIDVVVRTTPCDDPLARPLPLSRAARFLWGKAPVPPVPMFDCVAAASWAAEARRVSKPIVSGGLPFNLVKHHQRPVIQQLLKITYVISLSGGRCEGGGSLGLPGLPFNLAILSIIVSQESESQYTSAGPQQWLTVQPLRGSVNCTVL